MRGSDQCSSHRFCSIELTSHTSELVDSGGCRVGRWVHTSVSFQARQESAPVLSPVLPIPPAHCLGGNPTCLRSWGCITLCSAPKMPQHEAPALPSGICTLKHEVEKTCLSLLSAALQGCSSEYGPVGSGPCLWGSLQLLKLKLRSPPHIQPDISSLTSFRKSTKSGFHAILTLSYWFVKSSCVNECWYVEQLSLTGQ